MSQSELIKQISDSMQIGKAKLVKQYVTQALEEGIPALTILNEALLEGMGMVGEKFKNNEIFVPEVLVAARAMNAGIDLIKPQLAATGMESKGTAVIGTVKGDLHDIGKNLVAMMIESAGFEVIDLGVDVPTEKFLEALKSNPDTKIVALSALLTTTMPAMKATVEALNGLENRGSIKVMVGGAPITQAFADEIGADAYTADAASAAQKAKELAA